MFGWTGKILDIDLTRERTVIRSLPETLARTYIGGRGFTSRILYDNLDAKIDPLGPENVVVFAQGLLNGTAFPCSSRSTVAAKSPLTGILGDANMGAPFGPELKYAGYDAIIVRGKSRKPVFLWIDDSRVEIESAPHLWGLTTLETEKAIKNDLGDRGVKIASIGPAGENLVRFACVMSSLYSAAGRTGMGAVMGSKNLKALAVRGTCNVKVGNPSEFYRLILETCDAVKTSRFAKWLRTYGTICVLDVVNESGGLPTRHFQTGFFRESREVDGVALKNHFVRARGCFSCQINCGRYCVVEDGPYAGARGEGPEFESVDTLGPRCGNSNLASIIKANELCNKFGIDTMTYGDIISFAMDLFEKGIITEEDTDGYVLRWGNHEAIVELVEKVARREGFGRILGEGVRKAAQMIGRGAEKYAFHIKGLELPANDPRGVKDFGFGYVTASRGADHLRAHPCIHIVTDKQVIVDLFGQEAATGILDRHSPAYKGLYIRYCEDFMAVSDMMGVCKFPTSYWVIQPEILARAFSLATGVEMRPDRLLEAGERVTNLERLFNAREGTYRRDDSIPGYFIKTPMPEGPAKGQIFELDMMLDEYYKERGWDKKSGLPQAETLRKLGL